MMPADTIVGIVHALQQFLVDQLVWETEDNKKNSRDYESRKKAVDSSPSNVRF